jgi:hypothetical protein
MDPSGQGALVSFLFRVTRIIVAGAFRLNLTVWDNCPTLRFVSRTTVL